MEHQLKTVREIIHGEQEVEGAGVRLIRAFGQKQSWRLNPFLQLDDLHSCDKGNILRGFPWHPHRGMYTITCMFSGRMVYEDHLENRGWISGGDVQLIKPGKGLVHQEMPRPEEEYWSLQLWLKSDQPDDDTPECITVRSADIPVHRGIDGLIVRVLSGGFRGLEGALHLSGLQAMYDIHIPPMGEFKHDIPGKTSCFAYIMEGQGSLAAEPEVIFHSRETLVFGEGSRIHLCGNGEELRVLLCAARPSSSEVFWYGPIAAESREDLDRAYKDYEGGTFTARC